MKVRIKKQFAVGSQTYYPDGHIFEDGKPAPRTVEIENDELAIWACNEGWCEPAEPLPTPKSEKAEKAGRRGNTDNTGGTE